MSYRRVGLHTAWANAWGTRRIDFAILSGDLRAVELFHRAGPANHVMVGYDVPMSLHCQRLCGPQREVLQEKGSQLKDSKVGIEEALAQQDLDTAWTILSDIAEDLLRKKHASEAAGGGVS